MVAVNGNGRPCRVIGGSPGGSGNSTGWARQHAGRQRWWVRPLRGRLPENRHPIVSEPYGPCCPRAPLSPPSLPVYLEASTGGRGRQARRPSYDARARSRRRPASRWHEWATPRPVIGSAPLRGFAVGLRVVVVRVVDGP